MYIHERDNWTNFRWNDSQVSLLLEVVCRKQGLLYGRLSSLSLRLVVALIDDEVEIVIG